jgi:hypothetical protein
VLADALVNADAQRSRLPVPEGVEIGLGGREPRDDRLGVPQQQLARLGQGHLPRPTGALDELLADDPFQRRDLLRDRRLGIAERCRRLAERHLTCDRLERDQVTELDAEPAIRFHNRILSKPDLS